MTTYVIMITTHLLPASKATIILKPYPAGNLLKLTASFVDQANNRLSVSHNSRDDYCDTVSSIAMETIPTSRKATRNCMV